MDEQKVTELMDEYRHKRRKPTMKRCSVCGLEFDPIRQSWYALRDGSVACLTCGGSES